MAGQRKRYGAALKAKVALEAIKGQKTTNEIAAEYGVHPTQITQWKRQALDGLPYVGDCKMAALDTGVSRGLAGFLFVSIGG